MPELPETETIARDLDAMVRDACIDAVTVHRADVLRGTSERELPAQLMGLRIARVWRRAKLIVLDLAGEAVGEGTGDAALTHLVVQPRFTGALLVDDGSLTPELREYLTVTLHLADGRALHYRDVRRLGTVSFMSAPRFAAYTGALGPEPLNDAFTADSLRIAFSGSSRAIKAALMDQARLAGVGNIYATEALWEAGIDPSRGTDRLAAAEWVALHAALQRILRASVQARGTSFRDYRDATGGRGSYVSALSAYGREGQPCERCGRRLIGTHAVDGRNTVFCASCQR